MMKIDVIIYRICQCLSAEMGLGGGSLDVSAFIYDQYRSLPKYIRWAFALLYFVFFLRGGREATFKKWSTSRIRPLKDFIDYHRTFFVFYVYSQEKF